MAAHCGWAVPASDHPSRRGPARHRDPRGLAGYAWLGLVSGLLIHTLWFSGIDRIPVASAALLGLLSPIAAAVLGAVLLGQLLGPVQLLGFALALTALAAGQLQPTRPALTGVVRTPIRHQDSRLAFPERRALTLPPVRESVYKPTISSSARVNSSTSGQSAECGWEAARMRA